MSRKRKTRKRNYMSEIPGSLKPKADNAEDVPYVPSGGYSRYSSPWNDFWDRLEEDEAELKVKKETPLYKKDKWRMPKVWIDNSLYAVDLDELELVGMYNGKTIDFFSTMEEMEEFLLEGHDGMTLLDLFAHRYGGWTPYKYEPPVPVPLEEKLEHKIFEYGDYFVMKLPTDVEFIKKEGQQMKHCLCGAHEDY